MSSHAYKTITKPVPPPLSFAAAVRDMGDLWGCSRHARLLDYRLRDESTHDQHDAARMSLMEAGQMSREGFADERIKVKDYENAYPPIELDFNGLVYTAVRAHGDMGDPVGFDERSPYRAYAMLLDVEAREEG